MGLILPNTLVTKARTTFDHSSLLHCCVLWALDSYDVGGWFGRFVWFYLPSLHIIEMAAAAIFSWLSLPSNNDWIGLLNCSFLYCARTGTTKNSFVYQQHMQKNTFQVTEGIVLEMWTHAPKTAQLCSSTHLAWPPIQLNEVSKIFNIGCYHSLYSLPPLWLNISDWTSPSQASRS